jgi:hypothetical protein
MRKSPKFSPEVIERAVRMVFDAKDQYPSQWAAIESIAAKIGCTGETLRKWVRTKPTACPWTSAMTTGRLSIDSGATSRSRRQASNCVGE